MTEPNQSVSAKQARAVVALGKKYSKTAFPNPTRKGCPNSSTLRAMAYQDRRLRLKDLPVSHVVSCSPCFQEYSRLRRMSVLVRGLQATAASLVVLVVVFAAVRFVWNYTRGRGTKPQPRVVAQQAPPPIAPLAMTVNLASFSPTRGQEARVQRIRYISPRNCSGSAFFCPLAWNPANTHFALGIRLESSSKRHIFWGD